MESNEYHIYEGVENELGHTFNIGNVDYVESVQANNDAIAYIKALCAE